MAQLLSERTSAHLATGHPEAALQDVRQCLRLMEYLNDSGRTLVSAMIRVALGGLVVHAMGEGLGQNLWGEPELQALIQETAKLDLLTPSLEVARGPERAGMGYVLEAYSRPKLASLMSIGGSSMNRSALFVMCAPRGWLLQNQALGARLLQRAVEGWDPKARHLDPGVVAASWKDIEGEMNTRTPYNYLTSTFMPNYGKAFSTAAYNQTQFGLFHVAAALELYRREKGAYPEALEALVPHYLEVVPTDLVGGPALHYVRGVHQGFRLYSVGWNQRDDGGTVGSYSGALDWVWPFSEAR